MSIIRSIIRSNFTVNILFYLVIFPTVLVDFFSVDYRMVSFCIGNCVKIQIKRGTNSQTKQKNERKGIFSNTAENTAGMEDKLSQ